MPQSPLSRYQQLIDQCEISADPEQKRLVLALQEMFRTVTQEGYFTRSSGNFLSSIINRKTSSNRLYGMYIYGGVGRGKSMIMDMFFDALPIRKKARIHFHVFMRQVHERIHELRREGDRLDPLMIVANEIASASHVLCFDEFQVHDVADAMLLSRLFTELFDKGTVVIFTSNRPPADLYKDGIQRDLFIPFIHLIQKKLQIFEMQSEMDYRRRDLTQLAETYKHPLGPGCKAFMDDVFGSLTHHARPVEQTIVVQGRELRFPHTCRDILRTSFNSLCAQALGASDYLEVVSVFRTILLEDIPILSPEKRNEAKRFVTLIDVMYEQHTTLICTADAPPEGLYPAGDGHFEFERTVSRLVEMQTKAYLEASHTV